LVDDAELVSVYWVSQA